MLRNLKPRIETTMELKVQWLACGVGQPQAEWLREACRRAQEESEGLIASNASSDQADDPSDRRTF